MWVKYASIEVLGHSLAHGNQSSLIEPKDEDLETVTEDIYYPEDDYPEEDVEEIEPEEVHTFFLDFG